MRLIQYVRSTFYWGEILTCGTSLATTVWNTCIHFPNDCAVITSIGRTYCKTILSKCICPLSDILIQRISVTSHYHGRKISGSLTWMRAKNILRICFWISTDGCEPSSMTMVNLEYSWGKRTCMILWRTWRSSGFLNLKESKILCVTN